ncbi:putative Proteasome assembly chaperone 1-like protein [Naja naja]|nr:putative Proteasome assembly chaperone 1-like protein [Naja naja]
MATFFGEVVTPLCRAGLDDEEELAEEREETQEDREIRLALEKKRDISFLSSFILNSGSWELVGSAQLWNEWCRTSKVTNLLPKDSYCCFYRSVSDPTILLCQCNCYVAEDQQFQWLEKVFGCLQQIDLQVLVLSACPVTDYKTTESTLTLPSPFLKALKTREFKDKVYCSLLEQPNIIRDLPAAVLSYCQVWQIPAIFYQCYTDILQLDLVTIETFKPDISRSTEILTKLVTPNDIHNIYT